MSTRAKTISSAGNSLTAIPTKKNDPPHIAARSASIAQDWASGCWSVRGRMGWSFVAQVIDRHNVFKPPENRQVCYASSLARRLSR